LNKGGQWRYPGWSCSRILEIVAPCARAKRTETKTVQQVGYPGLSLGIRMGSIPIYSP